MLVNVQEWGCFSIFPRADDVTRTMSAPEMDPLKIPGSAPDYSYRMLDSFLYLVFVPTPLGAIN